MFGLKSGKIGQILMIYQDCNARLKSENATIPRATVAVPGIVGLLYTLLRHLSTSG